MMITELIQNNIKKLARIENELDLLEKKRDKLEKEIVQRGFRSANLRLNIANTLRREYPKIEFKEIERILNEELETEKGRDLEKREENVKKMQAK